MTYSSTNILTVLLILSAFTACQQKEDSRDHDLTDPTEELTDHPEDSIATANPQEIVQNLYKAVNNKEYEKAYQLWDGEGKASGKTLTEFEQGYAQTIATNVSITGEVSTEGAAGSIYAEVPVRIEARLESGQQQVFTGKYILRRRNINVDSTGSSWRIYDAELEQQ